MSKPPSALYKLVLVSNLLDSIANQILFLLSYFDHSQIIVPIYCWFTDRTYLKQLARQHESIVNRTVIVVHCLNPFWTHEPAAYLRYVS